MKIKPVVKVMNFHSLLRIDHARRQAEKYGRMEREIRLFIDLITNNRNFILDKHSFTPKEGTPPLNIYVGSDYSFCAGINSQVNSQLVQDDLAEKILIGKKLRTKSDGILIIINRDNYEQEYEQIREILTRSVLERRNSVINIVYNHYYNSGRIELTKKQIFPINEEEDFDNDYTMDFTVEGNVDKILTNLILTYIDYVVKITLVNSYASENIMRQNATTESLNKIEEQEAEQKSTALKEKKQKSFKKILDSFVKNRFFGGM